MYAELTDLGLGVRDILRVIVEYPQSFLLLLERLNLSALGSYHLCHGPLFLLCFKRRSFDRLQLLLCALQQQSPTAVCRS